MPHPTKESLGSNLFAQDVLESKRLRVVVAPKSSRNYNTYNTYDNGNESPHSVVFVSCVVTLEWAMRRQYRQQIGPRTNRPTPRQGVSTTTLVPDSAGETFTLPCLRGAWAECMNQLIQLQAVGKPVDLGLDWIANTCLPRGRAL